MTIDEAIAHALEVAGEQQERADSAELIDILDGLDVEDCKGCAADHRQLAEWLMELKDARAALNDCGVEIEMLLSELKEAKRLLKLAVEDLEKIAAVDECSFPYCDSRCPFECMGQCEEKHWKHTDKALKLIEKGEQNCGR